MDKREKSRGGGRRGGRSGGRGGRGGGGKRSSGRGGRGGGGNGGHGGVPDSSAPPVQAEAETHAQAQAAVPTGAIIIFLPGLMEITNLYEQLMRNKVQVPH